jgi:hypothetical protein
VFAKVDAQKDNPFSLSPEVQLFCLLDGDEDTRSTFYRG